MPVTCATSESDAKTRIRNLLEGRPEQKVSLYLRKHLVHAHLRTFVFCVDDQIQFLYAVHETWADTRLASLLATDGVVKGIGDPPISTDDCDPGVEDARASTTIGGGEASPPPLPAP
jgi:hypothetical protein